MSSARLPCRITPNVALASTCHCHTRSRTSSDDASSILILLTNLNDYTYIQTASSYPLLLATLDLKLLDLKSTGHSISRPVRHKKIGLQHPRERKTGRRPLCHDLSAQSAAPTRLALTASLDSPCRG